MQRFEYLGHTLLADKGMTTVSTAVLTSVDIVGLYFAGSWCPPCSVFTTILTKAYREVNDGEKKIEIVLVNQDLNLEEYNKNVNEMPWLAMNFDVTRSGNVTEQFGVSAIPSLIILNKSGKVICSDARETLRVEGAKSLHRWIEA